MAFVKFGGRAPFPNARRLSRRLFFQIQMKPVMLDSGWIVRHALDPKERPLYAIFHQIDRTVWRRINTIYSTVGWRKPE